MEDSTKKTGKRKRLIIVGGVLGLALVIGVFFYIRSKGFETTDNAHIDADIIPIRTSVS